jgi:hypothetical protein
MAASRGAGLRLSRESFRQAAGIAIPPVVLNSTDLYSVLSLYKIGNTQPAGIGVQKCR